MASRVTLQTIADRVGVSRMTVSNAFSRPDQLSATLRERILAAAQELGYVGPDPAARALARGTTGAVGILLTESLRYAFTDVVATSFLGAIAGELAPTGLALTLLGSGDNGEIVPARDVAMDGALVYSCDPTSAAVDWLIRRRLPLVYVDQVPAAGIPCVNVADRSGARAVARHVVELGHRMVGLMMSGVHGPYGIIDDPSSFPEGYASRQRLLGWQDVLSAAGARVTVARSPGEGVERVRAIARTLLGGDEPPTAVLCFSDAVAYGVIRAADDLGMRVPADVSVTGFDDSPLAAQGRPALTTVRQDVEEKGRAAAAALTTAIGHAKAGTTGEAPHILLPTELVVRDSTAPPPR